MIQKLYKNELYQVEIAEDGTIKIRNLFGFVYYGKLLPDGNISAKSSTALAYIMKARKQFNF